MAVWKKTLALLLAFCLCLMLCPAGAGAAWSGESAESFDGGSGTADDPYLISTPEQLALFRDRVNKGEETISASLTGNVDMGGIRWDPIGLSSSGYRGTFNGNGYAIRRLNVATGSAGTSSGGWTFWGVGLFGILGSGGVVKHVNVDGKFSAEMDSSLWDIGSICGANLGTIEECFATVDFSTFDWTCTSNGSGVTTMGGITGVNSGVIRNCYVVGRLVPTVRFQGSNGNLSIGGVAGQLHSGSVIENCYVCAPVEPAVTNGKNVRSGGVYGHAESLGQIRNVTVNSSLCPVLNGDGEDAPGEDVTLRPDSYMKSRTFADSLGGSFAMDTDNVNQGYPVLPIMAYEEESGHSGWIDEEIEKEEELFDRLTPAELKGKDLSRPISRAEFCAVAVALYEEMGGSIPQASSLRAPFTDISSDDIVKAYHVGITDGVDADRFDPYSDISREAMSTMLTRVYKSLALDGWTLEKDSQYILDSTVSRLFTDDGKISGWARSSVYFMAGNNIIEGFEDGSFRPRNTTDAETAVKYANATREQAIIVAVRMYKNLGA